MLDFFSYALHLEFSVVSYGPFKISYNTYKDKWLINELVIMCVHEEPRLVAEMGESAYLAIQEKNKNQTKPKGKGKGLV